MKPTFRVLIWALSAAALTVPAALAGPRPAAAQLSPQGAKPFFVPQLAGKTFWLQGLGRSLTIRSLRQDGSFVGEVSRYTFYPPGWQPRSIGDQWIRFQLDLVVREPVPGGRFIKSRAGVDPIEGQISPAGPYAYSIIFSHESLTIPQRRCLYEGRFVYHPNTGTAGIITGIYVKETRAPGLVSPWRSLEHPQPFTGLPQAD